VAVVDSGVDLDHPDLQGQLLVLPGSDVADGDGSPDDDSEVTDRAGVAVKGHGTSAAGVVGAATNNQRGIAGVAPDTKIMPVKVFPSSGSGTLTGFANVPRAIRFAVDNGADVINLSLGTFSFDGFVGLVETPCAEAYQRGALCVVASGNGRDRSQASGYQRGVDLLLVTANDESAEPAPFAQNADSKWGLSAPGVRVYSTTTVDLGEYNFVSGTSFAAPHAAGAAALLFAQGLSASQVVGRLLESARPMGNPQRNGAGLLDAAAAVGAARTVDEGPALPPPGRGGSTGSGDGGTTSGGGATGGGDGPAPDAPQAGGGGPGATDPNQGLGGGDFGADLLGEDDETADAEGAAEESSGATTNVDLTRLTLIAIAGVALIGNGLWLNRVRADRRGQPGL